MSVPMSKWRWEGHAGHFIGSRSCGFRMHTRVGDYRISTVGDYYPPNHKGDDPETIGVDRTHETFVFRVAGPGEGEITEWSEIDTDGYNDCEAARAGHLAMCRKYARMAT